MENIKVCWIEEAEAVTQTSLDILEPTIRAEGSEIWISFNPNDELGATYQEYVAPYLDEITKNGFYEDDHIYVRKTSWRDADKLGLFPDELRHQMEKMKKDDYRKYLHIWEGEPNTDYSDSIIQPEWVEAAIDAHIKLGFEPRGVKVVGFDPADEGNDAKAVCMRHGVVVTEARDWKDGDLEDACVKAFNTAYENRCTNLVYDSIGVGAGVKMKMRSLNGNGDIDVEGFCGSEQPTDPTRKYQGDRENADIFRNKRAQWWWYLRDRFEATYRAVEKGEYTDPDQLISLSSGISSLKLLKAELTRVQRKRQRSGNSLIQIESKQDMKARALTSPNLADALVYTFANRLKMPGQGKPLDYSKLDKARY